MESQNNIVRTLDYVNRKKTGGKAYIQGVIALAIVLISALVAAFVYVPYIAKTKEIAKKRASMEQEVQALQKKYDTISMKLFNKKFDKCNYDSKQVVINEYNK